MQKYAVWDEVEVCNTDSNLDGAYCVVMGFFAEVALVMFPGGPPAGHNPVIGIVQACLKKI